jgi:hypothetical protein
MPYRARSILPRLAAASALAVLLAGCAALPAPDVRQRVDALLPADLILLGEQHDADAHQQLQRAVVLDLAGRGQLSALALEMADQGRSTLGLPADASETQVRDALQWKQAGWPWERYGPVVMAAVRHAVPVHGANLPREAMRAAIIDRFDSQTQALHHSARVLDDGVIDPRDTRRVLCSFANLAAPLRSAGLRATGYRP